MNAAVDEIPKHKPSNINLTQRGDEMTNSKLHQYEDLIPLLLELEETSQAGLRMKEKLQAMRSLLKGNEP